MALEDYRELFAAIAATAGALTGLLFVALSVAPSREQVATAGLIKQIRAAAAMVCFVNAMAVSLYALVPTTRVGYPSVVLGITGLVFTAAAIRSVLASEASSRQKWRQVGLFNLLILIFSVELVVGVLNLARPADQTFVQIIGYALVTSLIVGISRAWELIGDRATSAFASLAVLAGHEAGGPGRPEPGGEANGAQPGRADGPGDADGGADGR